MVLLSVKFRPSLTDAMLLFDLCHDPSEILDLAARKPEIVIRLKQLTVSKNFSCMCYQCGFRSNGFRQKVELLV